VWNHACFLVQINTDSLSKEKWSIRSDSKNNHYTHYACPQKNPLNMLSRLWIFICIANDSHCRQSVYLDISSSEENELINFIAWWNLQAILFPPFRSKRSYCKFKQCDLEPTDMLYIFKQYPKEREGIKYRMWRQNLAKDLLLISFEADNFIIIRNTRKSKWLKNILFCIGSRKMWLLLQ
jgi:hypothetical protein